MDDKKTVLCQKCGWDVSSNVQCDCTRRLFAHVTFFFLKELLYPSKKKTKGLILLLTLNILIKFISD